MVLPHGIEPRSSGYRPGALPLSYGRDDGARSRTRTWECRCVGPMPWPLGEASLARRVGVSCWKHASGMTARKQEWCTREDLNLHAARAAASEAAASAVSPRVPIWCWLEDSNLPPLAYEASALPDELSQPAKLTKGSRRRSRCGSDLVGAPRLGAASKSGRSQCQRARRHRRRSHRRTDSWDERRARMRVRRRHMR